MDKKLKEQIINKLAKNERFCEIAKDLEITTTEVIKVWNEEYPKNFKSN